MKETASIRIHADNPDHHLWNNNGTFWCHYTLHLRDYTKRRVRRSLGTSCLKKARKLRDQILAAFPTHNPTKPDKEPESWSI